MADERLRETENWKAIQKMVRKFPPFRSTSGGSLQFLNGFSGRLLFHLNFNRNFRIFLLNGSTLQSRGSRNLPWALLIISVQTNNARALHINRNSVGGFIKHLVRSRQRSLSCRFILPRRERPLLAGNCIT